MPGQRKSKAKHPAPRRIETPAPKAGASGGLTPAVEASPFVPDLDLRSWSVRQQTVLGMQRRHGNSFVQRLMRPALPAESTMPPVQRALSAEDKALNLTSPAYTGDARLEEVYDNSPAMRYGEKGEPVKKVQQGLIDDGFPMPISTEESGGPDGIFGNETFSTVKKFQAKYGLGQDGVVGRDTMGKLDELAAGKKPDDDDKEETTSELILRVMTGLPRANLDALRKDKTFVDGIQVTMSKEEFGRAAAILQLIVPAGVNDAEAARTEALRIMTAQLGGNKDFARTAIDSIIDVVIVPKDTLMTDLPQFAPLQGTKTFDGREWEKVRGVGNVSLGGRSYTAMTEENLLGVDSTATFDGQPVSGTYAKGYSTSSHEYAHALHQNVLTSAEKAIVTAAYTATTAKGVAKPADPDIWVDGRQGCYASKTEMEFFAQLSNAYLGTNAGSDPFTSDPRHNGKDYVETHEPEVFALLEKFYGGSELPDTNPRP
jgi:peptidoglycan hydrolase-like protein with peptidoglycan-binding domain